MTSRHFYRTTKWRRYGQRFGVSVAGLALAGCLSTYGTQAVPSTPQSQTSAASSSTPGAGLDATVAPTTLGKIVVDGKGMTAWPAITSMSATPKITGITGTVGTITGVAGGKQVTINGRPIYTYAQDTAPGDTNGQGVSGVWYVISPSGAEIKSAPKSRY